MAELLPDRMGVTAAPLFADDKDDKQPVKTKRRQITNRNMAFTGQAKSRRCKFCFSLTHPSEDCDWAPTPSPAQQPAPSSIRGPQRQRNLQICYSWNHSPNPICAYPNCKYQHICIYCAKDPQATNRDHKALHCSRRRPPTTAGAQAVPPTTGPRNPGAINFRYQPY